MAGTMTLQAQSLTFEPPGPGVWERADMHHPRPVPRDWIEIESTGCVAGFRPWARRYGLLLDHFDVAAVHGFVYYRFRGVAQPEKGAPGPASKLLLKLLLTLHPELRARRRNAERVLAQRTWMADAQRWETTTKPSVIAANRRLQRVEIDALDDAALLAHIARCRGHLIDMIRLHHEYNGPVVPIGLLLTAVQEWTGRGDDALALMQGASAISSGRGQQLRRLADSIRLDHAAQRMLASDNDDEAVLMFLAQRAGEVGSAYAGYVEEVGHRLVGDALDHGSPYLLEAPELLVASIRTAVQTDDEPSDQVDLEQLAADVRSAVPQAHRAEFDLLLHEARRTYAIRDERSIYTNVWAAGIFRHALRCGGRRLVDRGLLAEPAHLVEATIGEVHALLGQAPDAPMGDELAARARFRQQHATTPTPRHLGGSPSPPPPLEWLPSALARINAAVMVQVADAAVERQEDGGLLRGLAASRGTYTGTARVVEGPPDFARLQRGDVLVTRTTSEAFNVVLPLLGAIVTDRGGVLSHAAIVSREAGIPAVVGVGTATARVPDGATVHVDGTAGQVQVVP